MKHLHLDCFAGISGDMMVGALLDLGWPESSMRSALDQLGLQSEFHVHVGRAQRGLIDCAKFDVHANHQILHAHPHYQHEQQGEPHHEHEHSHTHAHPHEQKESSPPHHPHEHSHGRTFREIRNLISESALPSPVRFRAIEVFGRIAVAEGKIHGQAPEDVGFHEVGAVDSIADIVAACAGLHDLGVHTVSASQPVEGSGWIQCAHGKFPLPAPATLEILRGISVAQIDEPGERITPTGAALLAEFAKRFGPQPQMNIEKIGYGAGTRNPESHPNLLRAILGTTPDQGKEECTPSSIVEIRCNLDDCTPEILSAATESLLESGALDVHVIPCQMKKNRSGFLLVVLCREENRLGLSRMIMRHTSAFGVRWHFCAREVLDRSYETMETNYGPVVLKIGRLQSEVLQVTPEFSSCVEAAERCGATVRDVYLDAQGRVRRGAHF